ncbi:MAG: septum formation protein Maf [Clostridia bacterium]|nr:septum formation protein Maf [Clostridia bacterium]
MIVLASASPRRRELLGLLVNSFTVRPADCDERVPQGLSAAETVEYLSRIKGDAVRAACGEDDWVISADTVVAVGDEILGKPRDEEDCRRMIRLLSGREHLVYTGVTLTHGDRQVTFHVCTGVTFYPVPDEELEAYIRTPEPYDKAGGYAIQGGAAVWIEKINGDYYNVVGFPVARVHRELMKMGFDPTEG